MACPCQVMRPSSGSSAAVGHPYTVRHAPAPPLGRGFASRRPLEFNRSDRGSSLKTAVSSDDMDLAVFRFTLGIPGFDDALIPRVVGTLGGGLVLANHFLASSVGIAPAQERAEMLGIVLAVLGWLAPTLEQRIKELDPGRGRAAQSDEGMPGSVNVFCLSPELGEAAQRELAWASFALLKNTNTDGLMLVKGSEVLLARGAVGVAAAADSSDREAALQGLRAAVQAKGSQMLLEGNPGMVYFPDSAALFQAVGGRAVDWLPVSARSLLMIPCGGSTSLCLWAEQPRALPRKQQGWAAAIAEKIGPVAAQ